MKTQWHLNDKVEGIWAADFENSDREYVMVGAHHTYVENIAGSTRTLDTLVKGFMDEGLRCPVSSEI